MMLTLFIHCSSLITQNVGGQMHSILLLNSDLFNNYVLNVSLDIRNSLIHGQSYILDNNNNINRTLHGSSGTN